MPKARKEQISLADTPYYHCVSRCVRKAYLCGRDQVSGQCYEHRRSWVEKRLLLLGQVFAIEVCAYAVMSNHTHVVLHVDQARAESWPIAEVVRRWHRLHKGTRLSRQYMNPVKRRSMASFELETVESTAKVWRQRLSDISWFMRSLNEYVARQANREDDCTGRFWEGRFKSQALLDEAALAACMVYVDLNPVRAHMACSPETSQYTSIQRRINSIKAGAQPPYLKLLAEGNQINRPECLPMELADYIELVKATAKVIVKSQSEQVDSSSLPVINGLNIKGNQWLELTGSFENCFHHAAGRETCLEAYTLRRQLKRMKDRRSARRLFG